MSRLFVVAALALCVFTSACAKKEEAPAPADGAAPATAPAEAPAEAPAAPAQ